MFAYATRTPVEDAMKRKKTRRKPSILELQYLELMRQFDQLRNAPPVRSQASELTEVRPHYITVTTYGAFEKPVV